MDLTTTYLGMRLSGPVMPGATPLAGDLDVVRRMEDSGVSAVVMHSLFEEQVTQEQLGAHWHLEMVSESFAEALSYFPADASFAMGPDAYLEQVRRIKQAVAVPVVASLNGTTSGGWLDYAKLIQDAGADALELNAYGVSTDPEADAASVEDRLVEIVGVVRAAVRIPIAVKLSPYYTALPHLVQRIERAGADGLVLFNRFFQPDVDPDALELAGSLPVSDSGELLLRLRWLAILSGQTRLTMAASGGVHTALDTIKASMCGAHAVQMGSALMQHGPEHVRVVLDEVRRWLEEHEYGSLAQLQGSMNLAHCPDPAAYERASYVQLLQSWRSPAPPG